MSVDRPDGYPAGLPRNPGERAGKTEGTTGMLHGAGAATLWRRQLAMTELDRRHDSGMGVSLRVGPRSLGF